MIRGVLHWTRSLVRLVALVPLVGCVALVAACSGSQPKEGEVPTGETGGASETSMDDTSAKPSKSTPPPEESGGLNQNQKEQMEIVLKRGAKKAENCTSTVADGKGGEGEVKVLFDGQKGKITDVTVGAPWVGTTMEACIKRSFIDEYVLPFDGDPLEVPYPLKIADKTPAAADPKKPGKTK